MDEEEDTWKQEAFCIKILCEHEEVRKYFTLSWEEWRKEMFYLTTHSTHFIYGYMALKPAAATKWTTLFD